MDSSNLYSKVKRERTYTKIGGGNKARNKQSISKCSIRYDAKDQQLVEKKRRRVGCEDVVTVDDNVDVMN
jgi:hypothetical protein